MTTSPEEPTAETSPTETEPLLPEATQPQSTPPESTPPDTTRPSQPPSLSLPRRQKGPSAIAEAAAAVVAGGSRAESSAAPDPADATGDDTESLPRMSAAAAEFAALTAGEPDRAPAPHHVSPRPSPRRASRPAAAPGSTAVPHAGTWSATGTTATPRPVPATPGRPRKALLAGAALLGALLIAVPFLLLDVGDGDRKSTGADGTGDTVLGDHWTGDAVGTFGTASPTDGSPSARASANEVTGRTVDQKEQDKDSPSPDSRATQTAADQQADPASTAKAPAPTGVRIRGHGSGRCVDVTGGGTAERTPLQIWDCSGAARQSWRFASDGTVRALGMCMDVDGGSRDDGARVQLVSCNGTGAQQFRLNAAHDLVNVQADKCVDVKDVATGNGARLQLWSCTGADNQKWSTA
ncbi:RICIN domain-containing protein [Streptomyces sp. NPDC047072]|uniref:ricin-type beta-trefoil lectin domain protein n=1 Tax=Streptomyces sp. NPDC047072 TaxID=3154809 RepID=UPI0033DFC9E5